MLARDTLTEAFFWRSSVEKVFLKMSKNSEENTCVRALLLIKLQAERFAKFTGKHLCQSLFFNKVATLMPANLLKKRLWHRCFPMDFAKFLRTLLLTEQLRWLLLYVGPCQT